MKTSKTVRLLAFAALALVACSKDEITDVQPAGETETVDVAVELSVAGMSEHETSGAAGGATAALSDDVLEVVPTPVTRATEAATENEQKITDLWVVQFIGDNLKYAKHFTGEELASATLSCPLSTEASSTVYFVANTDNALSVSDGTTKSAFEAQTYTNSKIAFGTSGAPLPMSYKHTEPIGSSSITVTLVPMVAKIRLVLTDGTSNQFAPKTVQICNVPANSSIFGTTTASATNCTSYDPDERTTFSTAADPITLYVPENAQTASVSGTRDGSGADCATVIKVSGIYNSTYDVTYSIYPGGATDYKIERGNIYTITATIKGMNPNDSRVEAVYNLTPAGAETANCYMVHEASTYYRFRANVMGNDATTTNITKSTLAPKAAKILWQHTAENTAASTVISDAKIETIDNVPYVKFKTVFSDSGRAKEGNALIAVYGAVDAAGDPTGNPIWSWHIWSTGYEGATVTYTTRMEGAEYSTVEMMTRNLGSFSEATSDWKAYGLLYQWGRKDPFVNSATTGSNAEPTLSTGSTAINEIAANDVSVTAGAIAYTIAHPTTFITNGSAPYDWYTATNDRTAQNDHLWGNGEREDQNFGGRPANKKKGSKSIYDPCPVGYRVPPQGTWTKFTTDGADTDNHKTETGYFATYANIDDTWTAGYKFFYMGDKSGQSAYYPAAGYRNLADGALYLVGSYGYYWSSSPYSSTDVYAGYLHFYNGRVIPDSDYYRAYGFSVRCAKDL